MLLSFWFTLIAYFSVIYISAFVPESLAERRKVEIKIGFLVRSRCLKHKQNYQQLYVFHHALNKMNQLYSTSELTNSTVPALNFVPVIAETFGDESASIKQTIALITSQAVNFIVGPQETCQVESQLASIFNVAMISHYCSQWSPFNSKPDSDRPASIASGHPMTFIQTKPPHWKIVERVVTLVGQLLGAYGRYPQNLVLLYFKEPSSFGNAEVRSSKRIHPSNGTTNSSDAELNRTQTKQQPANDAIQYKLIGELLEIKLNELLNSWRQSAGGRGGGAEAGGGSAKRKRAPLRPLAVLNWHTTFHYGYTKNPFRRLVRRHLFQQQSATINQCDPVLSSAAFATNLSAKTTAATMATGGKAWSHPEQRAAIYIVVGHYYEHLGLMMALSELDLLSGGNSFVETDRNQQSSSAPAPANQLSVVIGVDTKEYDERDDSVGFLRGLLMGATNDDNREHHNFRSATSSIGAADQLDRIAAMYRHYLGVVPAKPTRMAELLDEIRQSLYDQTTDSVSSTLAAPKQRLQGETNGGTNNSRSISEQTPSHINVLANQSTLDALPLTNGLLQFMRLPVEAFYLYDSMALLGAYFAECIQLNRLHLEQCSDGRRAREWFSNREYTSFVNHNRTSFDSQAQTEGLYTLIARRASSSGTNQPDTSETGNDDEFDLIPVGRFASVNRDSVGQKIDLFVDYDSIDSVWMPFWCFVQKSNNTLCANLSSEHQTYQDEIGAEASYTHILALCLILTIAVCLLLLTSYRLSGGFTELRFTNANQANLGWFDQQDERNFLKIVYSHLLTPEILHESDENDQNADEGISFENRIMVELHCHMFPFPSCRFVHWLTALHQLKEMMFQYQPSIKAEVPNSASDWLMFLKKGSNSNQASNFRGFFMHKHKGTNSLRLLLNKYKSINECFCCLSDLDHKSVVKLYGATLLFNDYGKTARLVVEQSDRGSLRDALGHLRALLREDENEDEGAGSAAFMSMLVFSLVNDLLDGLEYLHESRTGFHGELRATTCLLATNWRLKLSGFHSAHMRRSLGDYEQKNSGLNQAESLQVYLDDLVYSAPEVIENHNRRKILDVVAMRLADMYSFAFVFYELLVGQEPWSCLTQVNSSKLLIDRVKVDSSFRPPLSRLDKKNQGLEQVAAVLSSSAACSSDRMGHRIRRLDLDGVQQLLRSCWSHLADRRPQSVATLRNRLLDCCLSSKSSLDTKKIHGQVVKCYARLLELVALYRKENLALERKRSKEFELKLLPESVVAKLRNNPRNIQRHTARELFACRRFECVSFCSFRVLIEPDDSQVEELNFLEQLNEILDQLDRLVSSYQRRIHLLDSQVDSSMRFMVYAGEPLLAGEQNADSDREIYSHSQLIASFALQLIDLSNRWQSDLSAIANMRTRCGLHCGPAIGGLLSGRPITDGGEISSKLARYVLLGNSMLWANALESNGLPQRIQVSTDFRRQLIQNSSRDSFEGLNESGNRQGYVMIKREGKIFAKNLGELESYWLLNGPRLTASQSLMLLSASSSPSPRSCS